MLKYFGLEKCYYEVGEVYDDYDKSCEEKILETFYNIHFFFHTLLIIRELQEFSQRNPPVACTSLNA